jgi:hypothetical protein
LYKVLTVFPAPEVQESGAANAHYTVSAGTYEYPFRFKVWELDTFVHMVQQQTGDADGFTAVSL